ncbi:MAG: trypsin-like peptidase domain-containing protein [Candidatus Nitrosopolaris sp.]
MHYHSLASFGMMSVLLLTFTVSTVSNGYQKAYAAAEFPTSDRCFSPIDKLVDANNNNWTDVFENAKYSVVKVETGSNPYSKPELSTGFIYDNAGHIVTNYHVANSGNLIKVIFADGNGYRAQITGTDPDSDLAILQANAALNKEQMKSLPIGNSAALQVGENVGAIGYPFEQLSFSVGSIKQLNITRENNFGSVQTGLIQHDACGYHGSSGGPLLDLQGRVLGINSYPGLRGYDIPGLTLAIPSNTLQKIVPKLISQHSHNLSLFPWS